MESDRPLAFLALLLASCSHPVVRQTTASDARPPDGWLDGPRCTNDPADGEIRTETLQPGLGEGTKIGQTVRVHYVASLTTGETLHDTQSGAPHEIIVGSTRAFCGFERALVGMLPGEQRRVFVPWTLAFGEAGRPPIVPPRSDLVLVIDLFTPGGGESSSGAGPARPAGGGGRRR